MAEHGRGELDDAVRGRRLRGRRRQRVPQLADRCRHRRQRAADVDGLGVAVRPGEGLGRFGDRRLGVLDRLQVDLSVLGCERVRSELADGTGDRCDGVACDIVDDHRDVTHRTQVLAEEGHVLRRAPHGVAGQGTSRRSFVFETRGGLLNCGRVTTGQL
ncbi:hypothetical protein Q9Q99_16200 [Curtobacterium flaccumfaciens]|nr:hypothetical protein Q9Q99_16200 [Curtobacterium flaccumfaciens]